MGIEQTQLVDLSTDAFFAFATDASQIVYDEPDPTPSTGFVKDSDYVLASSVDPVEFPWAVQELYKIYSNGQYVSTLEVHVPMVQELSVTTIAVLYIRDKAVDAAKVLAIRNRIVSFNPSAGIDPLDWAREAIPEGVKGGFSLFDVRLRARIQKIGNPRPITDGRDAILEFVKRTFKEEYRLDPPTETILRELPERPPHPSIREVADPLSPTEAQREIDEILATLRKCDGVDSPWTEPVSELANYSEYMARNELEDIVICGWVVGKTIVPVLYKRNVRQVLWVFGEWPSDPAGVVEKIVKSCAKSAATNEIVIATVLTNFAAGLAAFLALFEECVKSKAIDLIECVTPGIAVMKTEDPWART